MATFIFPHISERNFLNDTSSLCTQIYIYLALKRFSIKRDHVNLQNRCEVKGLTRVRLNLTGKLMCTALNRQLPISSLLISLLTV